MKAKTEAKYICGDAKDVRQCLTELKPQFACRSNLSENEAVWPDIAVNNLDDKGCSVASSNANNRVSKASYGPPAFYAVSFGSGLYRGEGIFVTSTHRRAAQKRAS
jgi:hypothetical protein